MRETELIGTIRSFADQIPAVKNIIRGIGDDCAVVRPAPNTDLVFTTDFTLEDRHFTTDTHTPKDIGHKALARSLSDLAAMGADPVFCLVSLALPAHLGAAWMKNFYSGLTALARTHRIALAGGDLARGEKIAVDVMCCGRVPSGHAILRNGAKPGDVLYVSGELGGSALGFARRRGAAWKRHKRPEPRIELGHALRRIATSAMDLSDGLSLDLERLCQESKVGAELTVDVPRAKGASLEQALHGGEDYELLFTAKPSKRVAAEIAGVRITRIGRITRETGTVFYKGKALEPLGFDHFR